MHTLINLDGDREFQALAEKQYELFRQNNSHILMDDSERYLYDSFANLIEERLAYSKLYAQLVAKSVKPEDGPVLEIGSDIMSSVTPYLEQQGYQVAMVSSLLINEDIEKHRYFGSIHFPRFHHLDFYLFNGHKHYQSPPTICTFKTVILSPRLAVDQIIKNAIQQHDQHTLITGSVGLTTDPKHLTRIDQYRQLKQELQAYYLNEATITTESNGQAEAYCLTVRPQNKTVN